MSEDGSMARMPELEQFASQHDLHILTVADLISYRLAKERLIERGEDTSLPTTHGNFRAVGYKTLIDTEACSITKSPRYIIGLDFKSPK